MKIGCNALKPVLQDTVHMRCFKVTLFYGLWFQINIEIFTNLMSSKGKTKHGSLLSVIVNGVFDDILEILCLFRTCFTPFFYKQSKI